MFQRWNLPDMDRVQETVRVFSDAGLHQFVRKTKLHYHAPFRKETTPDVPSALRSAFERLWGSTYVALGRFLGTRSDLIPKEWSIIPTLSQSLSASSI